MATRPFVPQIGEIIGLIGREHLVATTQLFEVGARITPSHNSKYNPVMYKITLRGQQGSAG